jgi:hypothetical protein
LDKLAVRSEATIRVTMLTELISGLGRSSGTFITLSPGEKS